MHKGTTNIAFRFEGGIIMGVDNLNGVIEEDIGTPILLLFFPVLNISLHLKSYI